MVGAGDTQTPKSSARSARQSAFHLHRFTITDGRIPTECELLDPGPGQSWSTALIRLFPTTHCEDVRPSARLPAMALSVRRADRPEAAELAAVAAATFPLACPPTADPADIAAAIETNLSAQRFADYLADPRRVIFVASEGDAIVGYSMLVRGIGDDPHVAASVPDRPAVELSKMYVLPDYHRSGAAKLLMEDGIDWAAQDGAAVVWLGVNRNNERAQRFYRKHGFQVAGMRTFRLGGSDEDDFVMTRRL